MVVMKSNCATSSTRGNNEVVPLRFSVEPTLPVKERHHQEFDAKHNCENSTILIGERNEIGDNLIQAKLSSSTLGIGEKSEIVEVVPLRFSVEPILPVKERHRQEYVEKVEGQKAFFGSYKEKTKKGASFAYGSAIIGLVFKHNPQAPCEIIIGSESRVTSGFCYYDNIHKVHSIRGIPGIYVASSGTIYDAKRIRILLEREVKKTEDSINFDWVLNKTVELLSNSAWKDCDFLFASVLNREARLAAVFEEPGASGFVIKEFTCVALGCGAVFALEDFVDSAGRLGILDENYVHALQKQLLEVDDYTLVSHHRILQSFVSNQCFQVPTHHACKAVCSAVAWAVCMDISCGGKIRIMHLSEEGIMKWGVHPTGRYKLTAMDANAFKCPSKVVKKSSRKKPVQKRPWWWWKRQSWWWWRRRRNHGGLESR